MQVEASGTLSLRLGWRPSRFCPQTFYPASRSRWLLDISGYRDEFLQCHFDGWMRWRVWELGWNGAVHPAERGRTRDMTLWWQVWEHSCGRQGAHQGWEGPARQWAAAWSSHSLFPQTPCSSTGSPRLWTKIRYQRWRMAGLLNEAPLKDLHVLCCCQRPSWCPWSTLPPGTMMTFSNSCYCQVDVYGLGPAEAMLMWDSGGYIGIHGLNCCLKPFWCSWSMLPSEIVWISLALGHVEVRALWCPWGPCWWCPWSMLLLETIWKFMVHAAAGCYRQGSFFCSSINDCRFILENGRHWRLLWQFLPPTHTKKKKKKKERNNPDRKPRVLRTWDKDAGV